MQNSSEIGGGFRGRDKINTYCKPFNLFNSAGGAKDIKAVPRPENSGKSASIGSE